MEDTLDYFNELEKFYNIIYTKLYYKGTMPWCSLVPIKELKIFNKNCFDYEKFSKVFDNLYENEKLNFYNNLVNLELLQITPLEIKIIVAFYFKNDLDKVNKLLYEYLYYFDFYEENNQYYFRIIFHASEYYRFYLEKCYFPNEEFKNEVMSKLKNKK